MKITFLGTGTSTGIPVITCQCQVCRSRDRRDKRSRTSLMISEEDINLVIDTGPDFREHMLRENVRDLEAVLFTHAHKDHTAGLDDIRPFNYLRGRSIDVFATAEVLEALKREYAYIFLEPDYPGIPQINFREIGSEPFEVAGIQVTPLDVFHGKVRVKGFRIGDMAYITDANHIPPESMALIKGVKVLILNALRKEKHYSHFNLEEAIEISRIVAPQVTYFTHISHLMGLHADIEGELPDDIHLAHDGLKLVLYE